MRLSDAIPNRILTDDTSTEEMSVIKKFMIGKDSKKLDRIQKTLDEINKRISGLNKKYTKHMTPKIGGSESGGNGSENDDDKEDASGGGGTANII